MRLLFGSMADETPGIETTAPATSTEAEVSVGSESPAEQAPSESTTTAEESAGEAPSIAEAFAEAKAELAAASEEAKSTEDGGGTTTPSAKAADVLDSEVADAGQRTQSKPKAAVQPVLDRMMTLVRDGRIDDLSPEERGVFQALESTVKSKVLEEQRTEEVARNEYRKLVDLATNDPEAWRDLMDRDENAYRFWRVAKEQFGPNVAARTPTEQEIRADVGSQYENVLRTSAQQMAADAGLSAEQIQALEKSSRGRIGAFLQGVYEESVKQAVEKRIAEERPKIAAREREAAALEIRSSMQERPVVVPRAEGQPARAGAAKPGPYTFRDAFVEAREELARN